MNKLISKVVYLILIILSFLFMIFIGTYCNDLARYLLTPYSDFILPLTMLMVFPLFMLAGYVVGYSYLYVAYAIRYIAYGIRYLFQYYVYGNLFIPFHKTTRSFKIYKKIGLEGLYWARLAKKMGIDH